MSSKLIQNSEALKQQIRIQLDTIDLLQQSEKRRLETDDYQTGSVPEFGPLNHNIQDKLVHLGMNIVERDIVPDPMDYSPFSSTASVNEDPYSSYALDNTISYSQSSESSKIRSRRETSTTATISPTVSSVATTVNSRGFRPPELRQERRQIPPRNSSTSKINHSEPQDRTQSEEASLSPTGAGDFISVRATNYLVDLNSNRPLESISGYINIGNRPISSTAILDVGLDCNVISLARVQTLGLQMETPEDTEEPMWFHFENGERRMSSGQVMIRWSEGTRNRNKPFSVSCWVYEHGIRDLVLGRPFLDKREYYWNAAEKEE